MTRVRRKTDDDRVTLESAPKRGLSQKRRSWRETAMRVLRAIGDSANGMVHLRFDDHAPATVTGFRVGRD
jgi:hypothetical protein